MKNEEFCITCKQYKQNCECPLFQNKHSGYNEKKEYQGRSTRPQKLIKIKQNE